MSVTDGNVRSRALVLTPPTVVLALVLFAVALEFLVQAVNTSDWPSHSVIWGGLAVAAYAAAWLFILGGRLGNIGLVQWRFGAWILIWWAISYGLAAVTWSQPQVSSVAGQIAVSNVLRALWLVAVGITMWALGYFLGPARPLRSLAARGVGLLNRRFTYDVRSPAAPWILYAIGSMARLVSAVTSGRFGYVGNASLGVSTATGYGHMLNLIGYCAPFAVAAAALQVYRERRHSSRITLAILFIGEITVSAASGDKENFLIAIVAVIIPFCAARRRFPKAALATTAAFFLLVVIPFNASYRATVRTSSTTYSSRQAFNAAPGIFRQTVDLQSLGEIVPTSFNYLLVRVREIDAPAIILQRTPSQVGFVNPAQLVTVPISGFVPRFLWPHKPIEAPNYQATQVYYGQPASLYTASATTPIGDLYQHGGWIPVVIGMFIFGWGVRLFDDVVRLAENPHAIFFGLLLLPTVVVAEGGLDTILADLPSAVVVWFIAVGLTFRWRYTTRASPSIPISP